MKKLVALVIVFAMCMSLLTGCSLFPPKTAKDLLKRSSEAMGGIDNFSVVLEMSIDAHMEAFVSGINVEMDMPIEMFATMDRAGDYIHGNTDMSASLTARIPLLGDEGVTEEDFSESAEMYIVMSEDESTVYTNTGNTGWVVSENEDSMGILNPQNMSDFDGASAIYDKASFSKENGSYLIALKLSDALKDESFLQFMEENVSFDVMGDSEVDWEVFAEAIGDAEVVFTFDPETYYLVGFEVKEFEITDISFISGLDGMDFSEMDMDKVSISIAISADLSNFGEIEKNDVKVPKKVTKSAVEESKFEIPDVDIPDETIVVPDSDYTESVGVSTENKELKLAYNGVALDMPADYSVFLKDGWVNEPEGGNEFSLAFSNERYPGVMLYLSSKSRASEEDLKKYGCYTVHVSGAYCDVFPDISFGGITFGDSYEYVESILGVSETYYRDTWGYEDASWTFEYNGEPYQLWLHFSDGKIEDLSLSLLPV